MHSNENNEGKFEKIITQAWNDYKGAVTAYTVLNQRFDEDLLKVTDPKQIASLKSLHNTEKSHYIKRINNHFNYFQKIFNANSQFTNEEFCSKINREIAEVKKLFDTQSA